MASEERKQIGRVVKESIITTVLLGSALVLAIVSSLFVQSDQPQVGVLCAIASLLLGLVGGIYIVPKLSKRIIQFTSWRFSYSATPETAFFLVLTIIVGFSAVNTGNNLLYLIFSVLLAVLMASGIISEASLRGIDVSLRFPENIFATEETILDISLINRKRLTPSYSLTVGVVTENDEGNKKVKQRFRELFLGPQVEKGLGKMAHYAILPGNTKLSQRIAYTFPRRGSYHITGFWVSTKFPFGFLRKTQEKEASGEVVVYPNPQPIANFGSVIPALAGWLESAQRGSSSDLYLMRQYLPNDNMRHIDWKATAKARQLMVREFTSEDERRFSVIVDDFYDDKLEGFEQKFERGIVLAASLLDYFTSQGCEVRLLTPEQQTEFSNGAEHLYKMLRILALIQPHSCSVGEETTTEIKSVEQMIGEKGQDFKIVISAANLSSQARNVRIIGLNKL